MKGIVFFHTLGCRLNMAETALAADDLHQDGWTITEHPETESPDLIVINSCAVTGIASRKSRQAVRSLRKRYPAAFLVLMGCDAKIDADCWENDKIHPDLVIPHPNSIPLSRRLNQLGLPLKTKEKTLSLSAEAPTNLFTIEGAARFSERTRANLKIQDGCDFCCTYCTIPKARGPARSRSFADILREARELIEAGYRELVLCGVNISMYRDGGQTLATLLMALAELSPSVRIRIGSAEPCDEIYDILDSMQKYPNICRFLHLPLQNGSEKILEKMGRLYTAKQYEQLVLTAAEKIPGICLGTDLITGFPGEDEETFQDGLEFLQRLPLGLLHVFPFSPRPGTPAATMKGRPTSQETDRHTEVLLKLAVQKAALFAQSQIGKTLQVIIEENQMGWSDNYLQVSLPNLKDNLSPNTVLLAKVREFEEERHVLGEFVKFL